MHQFNIYLAIIPLALTLVACNEKTEEDLALHACEHVTETGEAVDAAADAADAPYITMSDEPYTITLVDGSGFVSIDVPEDSLALMFTDTADLISGLSHDGEDEVLAAGTANDDCPDDLPEHWDLDLHAGEWTVEFGPSAVDSAWLMVIAGEHSDEDHDDHDH